ncbi:hypothetical protein [Massilia sp.]|uniref:hypothetical protein n=1 Tax=Massilia sp. TaxID=1882437 RepID=UPI002896B067|nr:hypothetical protein [Massilia sp.]
MYDTPEARARARQECEEKGEAWARAAVSDFVPGLQVHFREWLEEKSQEAATRREQEQRRQAQEAIDAARESALVARDAAEASKLSAKWTMIAAIIAGLSVLVTLAQAVFLS